MTERITQEMLENSIAAYGRCLDRLGMLKGELRLQGGSKLYGNSFYLHMGDEWAAPGMNSSGIGLTKREAYDTVWQSIRILDAVIEHLEA